MNNTLLNISRSIIGFSLLATPLTSFAEDSHGHESHDHEPHKHEILIQNETAFLQGKGETQIDIGYEIFRDMEIHGETIDEDVILFAYEYGFTDRFQFSFEALHISESEVDDHHHEHKVSGFADIEIAASYVLVKETDSAPQASVALIGVLPTGDEDDGLGMGTLGLGLGANVSKMVNDQFGIHFSTSFTTFNDAEIAGHEVDVEEFSYGLSTSYTASENLVLLLEYKSNYEKETDSDDHSESITQSYIAPGALIKLPHHRELGISIPVGISDEAFDWGAVVEFTLEF